MTLPPKLEKQLWTSISELERNMKMPYVTSVEPIGIEKGRQAGLEASIADLELWGDRILDAKTLRDQQTHDSVLYDCPNQVTILENGICQPFTEQNLGDFICQRLGA